jgi:hypothetical protein
MQKGAIIRRNTIKVNGKAADIFIGGSLNSPFSVSNRKKKDKSL